MTARPPFKDASLDIETRIDDLLSRLTLREKAGQISQFFYLGVALNMPDGFDIESVPAEHRAFAQQPLMVQQAIRDGNAGSVLFVTDPALNNQLQRIAVEESRLGIPLLVGFDVIHGLRTIFPVPIALAATWSPDAVAKAQAIAAREARSVGIHLTFAPMIDIARDPRWGRIIEGAGEDPYLAGVIGAAQVRGFQGDLGSGNVLAGPKHFAGYGASRGGRDYDDVEISDSEFWNVYVPPFKAAIDAGAANVMTAYMDLNGVPATGNRWLLQDVLRDTLGFDGFTVSDANAAKSLEVQHFAKDATDAAVRAVTAGLDLEMAMMDPAFHHLPEAVAAGLVDEAIIDSAVRRVLRAKFSLGLFEQPYIDEPSATAVLEDPQSREQARLVAEESIVLLKNDSHALPLDPATLAKVAVIGELAASKRDIIGPWVFDHDTSEAVDIVAGLRARLGEGVEVDHVAGASIPARAIPSPFDRMDPTVVGTPADHDDDVEIARAVRAADAADVAIVVIGQRQNEIGEYASVSTLELAGRQLEQLQQIVATGTPVVVVVMSGRPLDLQWVDENVPAIVQVWYPGVRGGDAVANVLVGDVSPAARLPFTWPRHVGQIPMIYAHNRTFKPEEVDRRYGNEPSTPLYPFGYGLSYAEFSYDEISLSTDTIRVGDSVTVSVTVTNTSGRDADEVVQLYIHQRHGSVSRPVRELKAFERVRFAAGETRTVTFTIGPGQLTYWSAATRAPQQDATTVDIWAGADSTAELGTVLEVIAAADTASTKAKETA